MAKQEPEQPIDPEEMRAEEHVKEIMEKDPTPPPAEPPDPIEPTVEPTPLDVPEPTPTAPSIPADASPDDELAAIKASAEAAAAEALAKEVDQPEPAALEQAAPTPEPASAPEQTVPSTAPEMTPTEEPPAVASDDSEGFVVGQTNEPAPKTPEEEKAALKEKIVEDFKPADDKAATEAAVAEDKGEAPVVMKVSIFGRMKNGILSWWDNPRKRYATLIVLAVLIGVIAFVPSLRAKTLNLVGVRSSVIVTAYDGSTNLPLQNVKVSAYGASGKTDADGEVKLTGVKLGKQDVVIEKAGFATVKKPVELGMRVQDLGEVTLKAVGTQYSFVLTDFLSGKPAVNVPIVSGEATTKSTKDGKALLTVPPSDAASIKITVGGKVYRAETIQAPEDPATVLTQTLVPAAPDVYFSKESGKYDVYRVDVDGNNKKTLLPGTGLETPNLSLSVSEDSKHVAVVSSRDNKRNSDGYLLNTLTIVSVADGSYQTVDHSEEFVLIGWNGDALIYQQTIAGASAANSSRQKIFSYDIETGKRYQLANANYFGGALLFDKKLYYVVSSTDPSAEVGFQVVELSGSNRKTIVKGAIWSFVRTDYDKLRLQKADNTWLEYKLGDSGTKPSVAPSSYVSRVYADAADAKTSLWVDVRDTNGVIIKRNLEDNKESELFTQKYAQYIVRWLSPSSFIFRTSSTNEAADYAASTEGGKPVLVTEVSPSEGYRF